MKKHIGLLASAALQWVAPLPGNAAQTAVQAMASRQYLVGRWTCAHSVGAFSGTYLTTYEKSLGDRWLKQTIDFPATANEPAIRGEWIMGYDERRQAWVRVGTMSNGQYFAMRVTEPSDAVSEWKYVSFFPRRTPETPGSDATFTKKSDAEYSVEGPSYVQNGTPVTEHHTCKKG